MRWFWEPAWRVWRLRHLARVEDPPGRLSLLAGEDSYWVWWPSEEGVLTFSRTADNPCNFELSTLRMLNPRRYWNDWLGADARLVNETLRAVEHEGRPAWCFTAPYVKGGSPELTVDAELGLVVRSWRDDVGCIQEWTDLNVDPSLDASFFEYREG